MRSRLREIIKKQGRTQKWLCEQVGVNKSTMTDLVNEKHLPSLPVAIRIAETLGVIVEEIWYFEDKTE
jgi:putative transcriptional regulator